jgi:hypothetical protein
VCYHKGPMSTQEQVLAEHCFSTCEQVRLMICTSTLTYGMNLPVEALVFAGTKRYDPEVDDMVGITSKDFLNIAGRAGRPAFANQGLVQILPNWIPFDWKSLGEQYRDLQKLYLAPSEDELRVGSGLDITLDQISAASSVDVVPDQVSAVATTCFGQTEIEDLFRHTFAFFVRTHPLALNEQTPKEDPDQYARQITASVAEWIRHQEEEFPLNSISREAFRRSGVPSRACRHLYVEAGNILETLSPLKSDRAIIDEESFQYWLDRLVKSVQSEDCDFFYQPRVKIGDKEIRENQVWEKIWEYESEALRLWLLGATREKLATSRFATGKRKDNWPQHRASMLINRVTQQYAFALGSLLFFLECRWRELEPDSRSWDKKPKELQLEWKPHLAHLPLAVKWGVNTISALTWIIAGIRFRFAAKALGEIYPSDDVDHEIEEHLQRVRRLLREYRNNYPDQPDLTVQALRIQSEMKGLDYDVEFLRDVADACCGVDL